MDITGLDLARLRFPGLAGRLQAQGATASLIRELGDNYSEYNTFLAREVETIGDRPEPADYRGDPHGYAEACAWLRDVLAAEVMLRHARAYRTLGKSLGQALDGTPLVDAAHRLVSAETGTRTLDVPGSSAALQATSPPIVVP